MESIVSVLAAALLLLLLALQLLALRRRPVVDLAPIEAAFAFVRESCERGERLQREADTATRQELGTLLARAREEQAAALRSLGDMLQQELRTLVQSNEARFEAVRETVERRLQAMQDEAAKRLDLVRETSQASGVQLRDEVGRKLAGFGTTMVASVDALGKSQKSQLDLFTEGLDRLTRTNEQKMEALRSAVEQKLQHLQQDNSKQLEAMRATVDEKLQGTLEKRLGESFRQVSERLEKVAEGLGEMRTLASGVGDLKKVLTNVKTRGTWGEVQLGAMLEQVLTPEQYEANVATRGGSERVEYAVRLPGRGEHGEEVCWIPIDAKFPIEDWQRLLEAQERGDVEAMEAASRQIELRIRACARDIATKYLEPPRTTNFAILFLPIEGLYAEVMRRPGLADLVQREHRVVITGPTTLWAVLNSLQMGFRSLAIAKRSSEVWNLLSAVKTEWGKYGDVLVKVQKKLGQASGAIEEVQKRSRAIERRLRGVQELPVGEENPLAALAVSLEDEVDEEQVAEAG